MNTRLRIMVVTAVLAELSLGGVAQAGPGRDARPSPKQSEREQSEVIPRLEPVRKTSPSDVAKKPGIKQWPALKKKTISSLLGKPVHDLSWAKVSPRQPAYGNKAALVFVDARVLDGGQSYVDFTDRCEKSEVYFAKMVKGKLKPYKKMSPGMACNEPGRAVLWVNAPANTTMVAECDVAVVDPTPKKPDKWIIWTPSGKTKVSTLPEPGHLLFSFQSGDAGWYPVDFRGTHDKWRLFGCTIHTA